MHPLYHLVEILSEQDELNPLHKQLLLDLLPEHELYDLVADPHELNNLAEKPGYTDVKQALSKRLEDWIDESGDMGFSPLEDGHEKFFRNYRTQQADRLKKKREAMKEKVRQHVAQIIAP